MTAGESKTTQSQTTQSVNYSQTQEVFSNRHSHVTHPPSAQSPQHQPHAIPTYSAATNTKSMNRSEMHSTNSQKQITSSVEQKEPEEPESTVPENLKRKNSSD